LIFRHISLREVIKLTEENIMSISSIQSTAHTAPVNTQQDTSFSIADNTMPSGGGGNCDNLRERLFSNIVSAINLSIAEDTGRAVNGVQSANIYENIREQSGDYRNCDDPEDGTPDDISKHDVIREYLRLTGAGNTQEQAIGRIAGRAQEASAEQPSGNQSNVIDGIGAVLLWIFRGATGQSGYAN
jgi:hypothetical protein